jgi:hypothetical protein
MEKISWTDRVNNEAVLHRVKEEKNILHTIRRRKAIWIGHILCRNCLLSHIIAGKIIGTRRRGRRHKQLLDDLKEARRYWKLKEEAQGCTLWGTQFGRGYGPVARQTTMWLEHIDNGCTGLIRGISQHYKCTTHGHIKEGKIYSCIYSQKCSSFQRQF